MRHNTLFSLAAIFAVVLVFFACSSEDPQPPPSGGEQSGNGEQQRCFCKLNAGNCSQMSLSTCMELVNAGAAQIVSNCTADPEPSQQPSSNSVAPLPPSSSSPNTIITFPSSSSVATNGTFTDSRDSKVYKWVKIGTQIWMAENLAYNTTSGSTCSDCAKYGRLYTWAAAMQNATSSSANPSGRKGVCPTSWHLPSDAEWTTLTNYTGGSSRGMFYSGFDYLLGGYGSSGGPFSLSAYDFRDVGDGGLWWSATEYNTSEAYYRDIYGTNDVRRNYDEKTLLFSVRCVKD